MLSETPMSAGLGKRLAEAADGYRDGLYHYFIASRTFPYFLVAPSGSSSDLSAKDMALAELEIRRNQNPGRNYEIFGPFFTPVELDPPDYDFIEVKMMRNDQYQNQVVVRSFQFPSDTDAIFLSLSAYDKFGGPYYTGLYTAAKAQEQRDAVKAEYMASKAPVIHRPGTYITKSSGAGFDD